MFNRSSRRSAAPQVKPVIAELLRTCVHPATLNLRIERIIRRKLESDSESDRETRGGHITKFVLTDGELVIQALLHRKLSTLPGIADLDVGDIVEICKFVVRRARRKNDHGHVVYLGIEDCYVIKSEEHSGEAGVEDNTVDIGLGKAQLDHGFDMNNMEGGFIRDDEQDVQPFQSGQAAVHSHSSLNKFGEHGLEDALTRTHMTQLGEADSIAQESNDSNDVREETSTLKTTTPIKRKFEALSDTESDGEAFETLKVNFTVVKKRRQALHELSQNITPSPQRPVSRDSISMFDKRSVPDPKTPGKNVVRFKLADDVEQDTTNYQPKNQSHTKSPEEASKFEQETQFTGVGLSVSDKRKSARFLNPAESRQSEPSRPVTPTSHASQSLSWGPFHTLGSLSSPSLPSKSYVFTTLIIPTYVSSHLISRPNSSFPPKRHIKVVDWSLTDKIPNSKNGILGKGITVSVYRDAVNFKPIIGRVALIRGVVMQRLNGAMKTSTGKSTSEVILNVYPEKSRIQKQSHNHQGKGQHPAAGHDLEASHNLVYADKGGDNQSKSTVRDTKPHNVLNRVDQSNEDLASGQWFVDDHDLLRNQGYDVDELQNWWDELVVKK